jgi:hypothetical protein
MPCRNLISPELMQDQNAEKYYDQTRPTFILDLLVETLSLVQRICITYLSVTSAHSAQAVRSRSVPAWQDFRQDILG